MNPQMIAAALMRGQMAQPAPMLQARPPVALAPGALVGSSAPQPWNTTPEGREAGQMGAQALALDLARRQADMHPPGGPRLHELLREEQRQRELNYFRNRNARGKST